MQRRIIEVDQLLWKELLAGFEGTAELCEKVGDVLSLCWSEPEPCVVQQ